jgi:hypothetical protein
LWWLIEGAILGRGRPDLEGHILVGMGWLLGGGLGGFERLAVEAKVIV